MGDENKKNFYKLEDAVVYAVEEVKATHIVQRYFDMEEFLKKESNVLYNANVSYDVDEVKNCVYSFFNNYYDADKHMKTGLLSTIAGTHQTVIDVNRYLKYHSKQDPNNEKTKKLIAIKNKKANELPF